MAAPKLPILLITIFSFFMLVTNIANAAEIDGHATTSNSIQLVNETLLQWQQFQPHDLDVEAEQEGEGEGEEDELQLRRSLLYWKSSSHSRYYISYGALSANRVPCPPRSGRSYYTHNCFRARGPVHPYTRGCSAITRCRR